MNPTLPSRPPQMATLDLLPRLELAQVRAMAVRGAGESESGAEGVGKDIMLTYEQRSEYACKVCQNVPDEYGVIEHGRGCYVVDENGGGVSFVELPSEPLDEPQAAGEHMNQTLRNRLIAHKMAVGAIPAGTPNPVGAGAAFFASGKLGDAYREASAWLDGALELMRTAPDNPYADDDAFMTDLLEKIEARKREQGKALRNE